MGDGTTYTVPEIGLHQFPYPDSFTVTLIAINGLGCADTTVQRVYSGSYYNLSIPNALIPDGQSGYDVFQAVGIGLQEFEMSIYTTWGERIWHTDKLEDTQPAEGWDGTLNGVPVNSDGFIWKVEKAIFIDGTRWPGMRYNERERPMRTGWIDVIR